MLPRPRIPYLLGVLCILGGILLLAFTQVSAVLPDPDRTTLSDLEEGTLVGQTGGAVLSALLATLGVLLILGFASPAPRGPRLLALGTLALALPFFLILQTLLFVNGLAVSQGDLRSLSFTASHFFHTGGEVGFLGVYILFMLNLSLVLLVLGAIGYLLSPTRFGRALADGLNWAKMEATHIAATLFLVLSLVILFTYLLRMAGETDVAQLNGQGLLADNLVTLYYLLAFLLMGLTLTVAGHAFLLNWGPRGPVEITALVHNLRTIGRIERGLVVAAATFNLIILFGPTLPTAVPLSRSFAFSFSPRGVAYAFYLLLLPYLPYAVSQRRLDFLLRAGRGISRHGPFAERSLRLVLFHLLGLILLAAVGIPQHWDPLGLMLAYAVWTGTVLGAFALKIERATGLPAVDFNGEAGAPLFFVALGIWLTTGLMLWGSGNTFEVTFLPEASDVDVTNASNYGADILARIAAAAVVMGALLLAVGLLLRAYRVHRRLLHHYLATFLLATLATLAAFTVGVWTRGARGIEDAYVGFAFHQYYGIESAMVGTLLAVTVVYLAYALRKMLGPVLEAERRTGTRRPFVF